MKRAGMIVIAIGAVAVVAGASVVGAAIDAARNWNTTWWDD